MDRVAVFVDAGYLFAEGSAALYGRKLKRGQLMLDPEAATAALTDFAERVSGLSLLRIYWYDGTRRRPTRQQDLLGEHPGVKVRLGLVTPGGHQKGVDTLIVTDMLTLARNRAMADCVLLSGDEDLRLGVSHAQQHGVRVHLLGIGPARRTQSPYLRREADSTHEWGGKDLGLFLGSRADMNHTMTKSRRAESQSRVEPTRVDDGGTTARRSLGPGWGAPVSAAGTVRDVAKRLAREVLLAEVAARRLPVGPSEPDPGGPRLSIAR